MTTATINGKRVSLTITEKARLLTVFSINEPGNLACTSGSNPKDAYVVTLTSDGKYAQKCPCKAYGKCAHKVAVDEHLKNERRNAYCNIFGIYEIYG